MATIDHYEHRITPDRQIYVRKEIDNFTVGYATEILFMSSRTVLGIAKFIRIID